jgi:sugar phosphate isomerase/epimerase
MELELGMPTLIELKDIESCCELCNSLGLNFIEINMNLPMFQTHTLDIDKLQKLKETYGIYFTIHLDENLNICDFNQLVSAAYQETVLQTIQIAKILEIPILNMHMSEGVYFTLPDRKVFLFEQYKDLYLDALKKFMLLCEAAIGNSPVKISIENCDGYKEFTMEGIELLLTSKVFALTFDIGHSHSAGNKDEDFILKHQSQLMHMHIHDAIGPRNHLVLGTGEINLKERLLLAEHNKCRCVLETKTIEGLSKSVEFLKPCW